MRGVKALPQRREATRRVSRSQTSAHDVSAASPAKSQENRSVQAPAAVAQPEVSSAFAQAQQRAAIAMDVDISKLFSPAASSERTASNAVDTCAVACAGYAALPKSVAAKLRRGRYTPEAVLDLHGCTQAQAHPRVHRFVTDGYAAGRRLVLIITGKGERERSRTAHSSVGDGSVTPGGVLRRGVPLWLRAPELQPYVLACVPAHVRHGGAGAYYVYLRRSECP